jgi:hypothetical protein
MSGRYHHISGLPHISSRFYHIPVCSPISGKFHHIPRFSPTSGRFHHIPVFSPISGRFHHIPRFSNISGRFHNIPGLHLCQIYSVICNTYDIHILVMKMYISNWVHTTSFRHTQGRKVGNRHTQGRKVGKPNNFKSFGSKYTKWPKQDVTIG